MTPISLARRLRLLVVGLFAVIGFLPSPLAAVQPPGPAATAAPQSPALSPGDESWSSQFRYPGPNGYVSAMLAAPNGDIYVGGHFTQADDAPAVGVARWDGARWHALGAGIDAFYSDIYALALGPDGSLYVGGRFDKAGGVAVNNIARWDGASWHDLGGGMPSQSNPYHDPSVYNIVVDQQGTVYAAGDFRVAGGVAVNNIARWDGTSWHALGAGLSVPGDLLIAPDNSLYAGGSDLSRWDGAQWQSLASVTCTETPPCGGIADLAMDQAGNLYVAGYFSSINGTPANHIARWDGTAWHALGAGPGHNVSLMDISQAGTVYVAEGTSSAHTVSQWDGTAWTLIQSAEGESLYLTGLVVGADGDLYIGGNLQSITGSSFRHVERWDGSRWHGVMATEGKGLDREVYALATGPDGSLYAGGHFYDAGGTRASGIARWDGADWHALGAELSGDIYALAFAPDGTLYAAGDVALPDTSYQSRVVRWDGAHWTALGAPLSDRHVSTVSILAVAPDGTLYAGGWLTSSPTDVVRWDGSAWQPLGTELGHSIVSRVSDLAIAPDGTLYAGGHFRIAGGAAFNANLARWDGTAWHPMIEAAAEANSSVSALALHDGSLYVAEYTYLNEQYTSTITRWDGAQWHEFPVDSTTDRFISTMVVDQAGNLVIGGSFSHVGAQPARNIARWDGTSWHALGSGTNGQVLSLALGSNGRLSAGGLFTMAGAFGSTHIAQWTASDSRCGLAPNVPTIFYAEDGPVAITLRTPGTLACLSVQRIAASYPAAPAPLQTGAYWTIYGTDAQGEPASGMTFDLSLPRAGADSDDLVCHLEISWDCAAASFSTSAVTRTQATSLGIWAVADSAVPASGWDLADLAVNTTWLASDSQLLYTLRVGASAGGSYTLTMDLAPGLTLRSAPDMIQVGQTLQATGAVRAGTIRTYPVWVDVSRAFSGTITQTAQISGEFDRTLSAPPVTVKAATWDLADLTVDTSALTSTSILTYTLKVGDSAGGKYLAAMKLHPALTLVSSLGIYPYGGGNTLYASDTLAPGAIQSLSLTVRVDPAFHGAITQTALISGGMLDRTLSAPPVVVAAAWDLSALAVDTSALTSTSTLTYTLDVASTVGGSYTATLDLDPALSVLTAPGMSLSGHTLSASGTAAATSHTSFVITVGVDPSFSGAITQTARISGDIHDRTLSSPPVVVTPVVIAPPFRLYLPAIRR